MRVRRAHTGRADAVAAGAEAAREQVGVDPLARGGLGGPFPGLDRLLLPNTPEYKLSAGLSYRGANWDAGVSGRWVDDFRWVVGPFQGDVESYVTVDVVANWDITPSWSLGLNVANALDDEHWESFGGDLLGRRALGTVTFHW